MRIGLDCDGILYKWESQARNLLNSEFRIELPVSSEWNSIQKSITPEQWNWLWSEDGGLYDLFEMGDAYPEIYEMVKALRDIGDIVIITSVPRVVVRDRLDWLIHQGIWFDEFRTVNGMKDKSKIVPVCDVYIDDSSEVADDILEHTNAKMILWNRPWNMGANAPKSKRQYWRVDCWAEVIALCESVKELYA